MDRSEWLKQMREIVESTYDRISPEYWVNFGFYENETQLEFLKKFMERVGKGGTILSAACGAGRYDGMLLEAGHRVIGIDQSAGMLERARERFPQIQYQKVGLQEMDFHGEFDGAICMDAMENVCPEDWPGVMQRFAAALKPGGHLYFTVELPEAGEVETSFERAKAMGLPVVFGELADTVPAAYEQMKSFSSRGVPGELAAASVYHYYPSLQQVRAWIAQAGMTIEEEGTGSGYSHFLAKMNGF